MTKHKLALRRYYGMRYRCSENFWKVRPSYHRCSMSENFQDKEYFVDWCINQMGFYSKDSRGYFFALEKDLLSEKGVMEYSEKHCVFVPPEINNFILSMPDKKKSQSGHTGIYLDKRSGKYEIKLGRNGDKRHSIGYVDNLEVACEIYKNAKINQAHNLAKEFKDSIDERVYLKLLNFTID